MNAAVSLALTIAAMGPATPKPKTSGNLASPKPQPPPAKAPSKPGSWANLTEEEQQERDRAFEREHREDGHKISAHFATKKASQPQEASPAKTQPSSNTAARHASHEDTHTAQADNQPSDAASDVSDMRAEMAATSRSFSSGADGGHDGPAAAAAAAAAALSSRADSSGNQALHEEPPAHTEQTQPAEHPAQPTQPDEGEIEYVELNGDEVREDLQGATVDAVCSLHGAPQVYDGSLWFFFWSHTDELLSLPPDNATAVDWDAHWFSL